MSNSGEIYSVLDDSRINARADFFQALGAGIDGSWASRIGTLIPSNQEVEVYNWLGTPPQMAKLEGDPLFQQLPNYAARLRNVRYQSGLDVDKDDIRRDKTMQIRTRMRQLGERAATHPEKLFSDLIINGETDGSKTINVDGTNQADLTSQAYDAQAFFDTDHVYTGSNYTTAQSNDLSAGVYNVATATAPTAEEGADIVVDLIGNFYTLKDDQGEPVNANARNFVIMVGTNALWTGLQKGVTQDNLASGETNPARRMGVTIDVILNPRLSANTTKVYCFATDSSLGSFIMQEEVPLSLEEEDPGITSRVVKVQASAVREAGFGLWQKGCVATLS